MSGEAEEVGQVWTYLAFVSELLPHYDDLFALLTPEEQGRSARYLHSRIREEFVVGRACLRLLLGGYLRVAPETPVLTEGPHGKLQTAGVEFNLSHSHGLVAIALSDRQPVGIDVERADRRVEVLDVAAAIFLPEELDRLSRTADPLVQRRLFFDMWTAQEAQTKCLGVGLAGLEGVRASRGNLSVQRLPVPDGYHGAVCVTAQPNVLLPVMLTKAAIAKRLQGR